MKRAEKVSMSGLNESLGREVGVGRRDNYNVLKMNVFAINLLPVVFFSKDFCGFQDSYWFQSRIS